MPSINEEKIKLLKALFGSDFRVEILVLFFQNPQKKYYQREISFLINRPITGVQYELAKLEKIGLLKSESGSYYKFYTLNFAFPFYQELFSLFKKLSPKHNQ